MQTLIFPRPSKFLNFFIDHKLLDGENILLPNFNFSQKMGVVLQRPSGWPNFFGVFFYFLDNKLYDTNAILISN